MGQHQHLTYRAITMMRGGLISLLYNKTTDLGVSAVDPAAALTLMSADIERIYTGWQTIHEIWANVLEVGLAIFLLERQLGAAAAIPVAVAFGKYPRTVSLGDRVTNDGRALSLDGGVISRDELHHVATGDVAGGDRETSGSHGVDACIDEGREDVRIDGNPEEEPARSQGGRDSGLEEV